ncbi:MAG: AAA family ATPase, partial [Actinomycetota bacterium]|nr:AAA family ATPase [Actinomycetota bacterium]
MAATRGMSPPRPRTHFRDGLGLACLGLAGWGAAPLLGEPAWALPALVAGVGGGAGIATTGHRTARRAAMVGHLADALAPLLGITGRGRPALTAHRWTRGWPGTPRRLKLQYGTGRVKVDDATPGARVELGESRWASEVARQVSRRLGNDYVVCSNDPIRGKLTLKLQPSTPTETTQESPQVGRAKRVVNELLGGTATIGKVDVDEETGEVRRLSVKHEVGAKLVAPGYRNRVERTVSVMLPGRWRAKWDMEGDTVTFEVRPTLPESLWIPPLELPDSDPLANYRAVEIPYGVDEDSEAIAWRPAITPQWLITGETGSGKTSTGHGILTQITKFGWPVWIADGKGIEFLGFQDWPNVQIVASTIAEQVAVIHRAWQLMERRYQLVVERRASPSDFEPLMVFVDEFTDLK